MKNKQKLWQMFSLLLCVYGMWVVACRQQIYESPTVEQQDISAYYHISDSSDLTEEDYQLIFQQTGVTEAGMDTLIKLNKTYLLGKIQTHFYEEPKLETLRVNVFCHQEWKSEATESTTYFVVEDGDIIITLASYLGGWRYGHCGLILDASEGTVLEAVTYGEPSSIKDISHWSAYPAFVILRPKATVATEETKQAVVNYATEELLGIPYDLLSFKTKNSYGPISRTHCSHLVWYAYHSQGLDLDRDGTPIVTPYDIIYDDDLELVQVYGMCLEGK
jgi:uncharacterized protein YycO